MSDQDRISPYIINTISSKQVMRIKKNNYLLRDYKSVHNATFSDLTSLELYSMANGKERY